MVDNVEDLQIQYCVDDGTDTQDCSKNANWSNSFTAAKITNLWGVRISLVLRSRRAAYQSNLGLRPKVANHTAATSKDKYKRFVVSTEVAVRNLRLLSAQ